ncbi:MAG TPA: hypothetical protein VGM37_15970 [Armatimonadota bacterium]|jgi:hypothetical protein
MRLAGAIILLFVGALGRAQILDRQWARMAPKCSSYTVAPDGRAVVAGDWDGHVQCMDGSGRVLWRLLFPREVHCVTSAGAQLTAAYARDVESYRKVFLLDGAGRTVHLENASGSIRSVAVSEDGHMAAILSEPGRITVVERVKGGWRWRRRLLAGPVASLSMDAAGNRLAVALREPAEVEVLDRNLRLLWRWRGQEQTVYRVQMDRPGRALIAAAHPPAGIPHAIFWSVSGSKPLWSHTLRGDLARVMMAPDGKAATAEYRTRLWHGRRSVVEARVALFSPRGRMLWEVGGLMFGAHLVGVSRAPLLILTHDGGRVLAALDGYGHMRARFKLPAGIQSTEVSANGAHFAVLTDERILYFFRVKTQPG